jgi:hypothetical protein
MIVKEDIEIAEGVTIKEGAHIEMDGDGYLIITRGNDSFKWTIGTYEIYNEVRVQNGLRPI